MKSPVLTRRSILTLVPAIVFALALGFVAGAQTSSIEVVNAQPPVQPPPGLEECSLLWGPTFTLDPECPGSSFLPFCFSCHLTHLYLALITVTTGAYVPTISQITLNDPWRDSCLSPCLVLSP